MQRLKHETTLLHNLAESHPFQKNILKGRLSLAAYIQYLEQMHDLHSVLDSELRRLAREVLPFCGLVEAPEYQQPYLARDLRFFGVDPAAITPLPATTDLCEAINNSVPLRPFMALGCHYVLEGSKNGSKFIARAIRDAFGLPGNEGTAYLDPYGPDQPARWAAFKVRMNALDLSEAQATQIIEGATLVFEGIMRICDDLIESESQPGRVDVLDNSSFTPAAPV